MRLQLLSTILPSSPLIPFLVVLVIFFQFFSIFLAQTPVSATYGIGNSPRPTDFCTNQTMINFPLTKSSLIYKGGYTFDSSGNLKQIYLARSGVNFEQNYVYVANANDWQNGFVTTFNMAVDSPTCYYFSAVCLISVGSCWWRASTSVTSRCGADGFAMILRYSQIDGPGLIGGGLGYKGIYSALAIEFDTFTNTDQHDPDWVEERHISVIIRPGQNNGDENDRLAWNYRPLNFKSDKFEGYLINPSYRIEYLNRNLRVYINGVLQLEYYDPLDAQSILGMPTANSYLGFTGSTGGLTNNNLMTNWVVKKVIATYASFKVNLDSQTPRTITAGDNIVIDIYMYDSCNNRYVPYFDDPSVDSPNFVSMINFNNGCSLMSVNAGKNYQYFQTGPAFQAVVSCLSMGAKTIQMSYKGATVGNSIQVTIYAGALWAANVTFPYGTVGSVDAPFNFTVIPLDRGQNIAKTDAATLKSLLNIYWTKNPADTVSNYNVIPQSNGYYIFVLNCQLSGQYGILSKLLIFSIGQQEFFTINAGAPDPQRSMGKVVDLNHNSLSNLSSIPAGTSAILSVQLMDKSGNVITLSGSQFSNYQPFINEAGVVRQITENPVTPNNMYSTYDVQFIFKVKGTNILIPKYNGVALSCSGCQYQVSAGPSDFNYADLFIADSNAAIKYSANPNGNNYTITKPQNMNYLLVLKDSYGNTLDSVDVTKYTAILLGNNMNTMALSLLTYAVGAQVAVPASQSDVFQNLVGRSGYWINVTQTLNGVSSMKGFKLTIVSDGSDNDADNGNYTYLFTSYYWIVSPLNGISATAGVTYQLAIQLNTNTGMRYNNWVSESRINFTISPFYFDQAETYYPITKGPKPGVYTVQFVVTQGTTSGKLRSGAIYVDTKKTPRAPIFKSYPAKPAILTVDSSYLQGPYQFQTGTVLSPFNFFCQLTDIYGNLVNTAQPSDLNLVMTSPAYSTVPTCVLSSVGRYYCTLLGTAYGNAKVNSPFFTEPYTIMMMHGNPTILNSNASINNDVSSPLTAGVNVVFRITPKDSTGATLLESETNNYLGNFSVSLKKPDGSLQNVILSSSDVLSTGDIQTQNTITQVGSYSYVPMLNGQPVICQVCAFQVAAGVLDSTKTMVFMLVGSNRVQEDPSQTLQIDNTQITPIFYLQFYDLYMNQVPVSADYSNFKAVITVPGSNVGSYSLTPSNLRGDERFELVNSLAEFQFELGNSNCSLEFTADKGSSLKIIDIKFPKVILAGSANDSSYTNDPVDPKSVKISPNTINIVAGEFASVTVELRAANGKLFRDVENLGWYSDAVLPNAFTLKIGSLAITNPGILRAKLFGTYTVTFTSTVANYNAQNLVMSYQDPLSNATSYIQIIQTVSTTVMPSNFNYLVLNDPNNTLPVNCKAASSKVAQFYSYDVYSNVIQNINTGSLGFKLKNTNAIDNISPTISANPSTGLITLSMVCKKAGTVTLTSASFKSQPITGTVVPSYSFNIIPGTPNPIHSLAYLSKSSMNAGDIVQWIISPSDIYDNSINITVNDPDYSLVLFNSTVDGSTTVLSTFPTTSSDGSTLIWNANLTVAGTHYFRAYYQNQLISSTMDQITVNALGPFFPNCILAKYSSQTSAFVEYSDKFTQDISQNPVFKVNYYDLYMNPIAINSYWSLNVYLDGAVQNITKNLRIEFCPDSKNVFYICSQNAADQSQLSQPPQERYSELVSNLDYNMTMINLNTSSQNVYDILLTGTGDNSTKNLPVDPANTIITPTTTLVTTAGQSTTFTIELRTTLANYRRNFWYDNPMQSLKLQFKYNQSTIYYNITKADITDRYFVEIRANETHSINDPNIITVVIESTPFVGYQPKWVVNPAGIASVLPVTLSNGLFTAQTNIPQGQTVDTPYTVYFEALDMFSNFISLSDGSLNVFVKRPSANITFSKSFVGAGILQVNFQPKIPDTYTISFGAAVPNSYSTVIQQGAMDVQNSYANLKVQWNDILAPLVAGTVIQVQVYPRDQWGNQLALTNDNFAYINYFYNRPGVKGYIVGESKAGMNTDSASLYYNQTLTIKGNYLFKVSINDQEIRMILSLVNVIPARAYLSTSILEYLDDEANDYVEMYTTTAIKEDNNNPNNVPRYLLTLADIYGNLYDNFTENTANFKVILNGGDYNNGPLQYDSNQIVGNSLAITVNNNSLQKYHDGVANTYNFNITWNRDTGVETIVYPITFLGENGANDSEILTPADLNQTWLSTDSLQFVAGTTDQFLLEIRCADGKRKADFHDTITFTFSYMNGTALKTGNYSATIENATLKGRFLVTVYGELANNLASPFSLKMFVGGVNQIPETLNITVTPASLDHIALATDLVIAGDADHDYVFNILPYDKFSNIADVTENDVNLRIIFPISSTNPNITSSYTSNKDPASGAIIYTVKSRVAGTYQLQSSLLVGDQTPKFIINPGAPSVSTSNALVNPSTGSAKAGDTLTVNIVVMDAYYNKILAGKSTSTDQSLLSIFSLGLAQGAYNTQLQLIVDTPNNNLQFSVKYTQAGVVTFSPQMTGSPIQCTGCVLKVSPGDLDIENTKFYALTPANTYNETRTIQTAYGSTSMNFFAKLYDTYGNIMEKLQPNSQFEFTMSGNNMDVLTFNTTSDGINTLLFSLYSYSQNTFSRLVPRNNYTLSLNYTLASTQDYVQLAMVITGTDDGSGNGPFIPNNVFIQPQSITIPAGKGGYLQIELRTSQNLRYNGLFDITQFQVNEDSTIKTVGTYNRLNYTFYNGNQNGAFILEISGTQAFIGTDKKNIYLTINGTTVHNPIVEVIIIPSTPMTNLSVIISPGSLLSAYNVQSQTQHLIIFQLYDQYMNLFARADLAPKLQAKVMNDGTALFNDTYLNDTNNNNSYVIPFYPVYPPRILYIQVFYNQDANNSFPITTFPFVYNVFTVLDPDNTAVVGANLSGVAIGNDFNFTILLKDNEGYCVENSQTVTFNLLGPFLTNNVGDNTLTAAADSVFNQTFDTVSMVPTSDATNASSGGYICMRFYKAYVPGNTIKLMGYYQIEVIIDGVNQNQPVKVVRQSYMTAGLPFAANSLIVAPSLYGRGSNPLGLLVNTPMTVLIYLRDSYKNLINDTYVIGDSTKYFDFTISGLVDQTNYQKKVTYISSNATFVVQLTVEKTGLLGAITASLLGVSGIPVQNLDKIDYPSSIQILAGPCSVKNPQIDFVDTAVAGDKQYMIIQCKDDFNNTVTVGGASFSLKITGQVDVVGIDVVNANVKDLNNGQYSIDYIFTWSGNYTVLVFLSNVQYTSAFYIKVINAICDTSEPYQCLGSKPSVNCSSNYYRECGYSMFNGCTTGKPFKCSDGSCAQYLYECSCSNPDDLKCDSDQKCIDGLLSNDLCAVTIQKTCEGDFPASCPDGSCRIRVDQCPSYPGCPPGTMMCADQTCVDATKGCPSFSSCQGGFKCEDQSCVNDLNNCPTRMTCNTPGWIICPDKTCASDESHCTLPTECPTDNEGNQLVLCPDQSCRNTRADCPTAITCPVNYALCEDGSCRPDCSVSLVTSRRRVLAGINGGSKLFRLLVNSSTNTSDSDLQKCPQVTCPGGECVDNKIKCSTVEGCPAGMVKCADLSCAKSQQLCLVQVCPAGKYHCWDGTCATNSSNCPTRSTCPSELPVKCPDGSCTTNSTKCSEFIECPAYSPYRCATGECRKKSTECPTLITCPTIKPFLCSDNTCQTSAEQCLAAALNSTCSSGTVRCPDGSCAFSKELCPTVQSCTPGQVRCWDSSCADALDSCPPIEIYSTVCPVDAVLRCPDGSCRANLNDCPTQIICPIESPVRCDDGTCKQSNSLCAVGTQCPSGFKRCPDGSCTQTQKCGTSITCSSSAPFLCYDNTCKIDPRDCPQMPTCSEMAMVLCPDGTCVSQRILCTGFEKCEDDAGNKEMPVRCPDLFCYSSKDDCEAVTGCPGNRFLCDDGSCAKSSLDCPAVSCPIHLPFQCNDGFCVSDLNYCNQPNGCSYNQPFKCQDGTCAASVSNCPNNNTATCPTSGDVLCPDGSCAKTLDRCPNALGCSADTPMLCGNGICVNLNKTSCPIMNCPSETPIKCMNGLCVKSTTYCSSVIPLADYAQCENDINGNNVPCADGRCVASSDLCRPLVPCDDNNVRCPDQSCRPITQLCPLAKTCPANKPYRCDSGACAADSNSCPTVNGCPANFPWKCELSGTCVQTNDNCTDTYKKIILRNNCTIDTPFKCPDNSCASSQSACPDVTTCSNPSANYKCFDGSCAADQTKCPLNATQCAQKGMYLCPNDNKCVSDKNQCLNKDGCPASAPYKCADGRCVSTPFSLFSNGLNLCTPMVVCPKYRPYLCGDGECQGHPSLCRTQTNCPTETPYRCPDQSCAATKDLCLQVAAICPPSSPFRCVNDGRCVSQSIECQTSNNLFCPTETPFPCASGQCAKYPAQCVDETVRNGKVISRILESSNSGNASYDPNVDPGCNSTTPHRCYDGSCKTYVEDCPLSNGCLDMNLPYKCLTGMCVAQAKECEAYDSSFSPCTNNLTLCEDGYCRSKCPEYNGCPNSAPLLCPNGYCAISLIECAGDAACPTLNLPYRCVDNTCVLDRTQCKTPKRNYMSDFTHITVSPLSTWTIDFLQAGENSPIRYGELVIPAGSVLLPTSNTTANAISANNSNTTAELYSLVLAPVPLSLIMDVANPIDPAKKNYTDTLFPYMDGVLQYHQSVRSPIVKLQIVNRTSENYRFPMMLYLSSDILDGSNVTSDYCIGRLNNRTNKWECQNRTVIQNSADASKLGFMVAEDGVYSVIFNPTPPPNEGSGEPCGFFCEYKMTLLYTLIGLVAFSVIFTYAVWRISRYVTKYREAKKQMSNYREQISELEQAQTDIQGQTIKDKIEGISFTTNPAFKEQSADMSEKIGQLERTLESSQKRNTLLEKANSELKDRNSILNEEFENLKREMKEKE